MYEKLEECPSCGFTSHENHLICDDHAVTQESFALVRCPKCQLVYTNPRPSTDNISAYYQSKNYISHTSTANDLVNTAYKFARYFTLRWKFRIIQKLRNTPGSILDYGSGTGDFLKHMASQSWNTAGVEPNDQARQLASQKGLTVHPSLPKGNKKNYDIITAWHVLEHVHQLKDTLRQLRKQLTDSGHMVIALPNHTSYDAQHYESYWAGYDVPRHLYHFSPQAFHALLNQVNLKLSKTLPMPLDAYYVSILSERYTKSKQPLISGLKTGFKSNQHAKRNDQHYSSLIYVVTK